MFLDEVHGVSDAEVSVVSPDDLVLVDIAADGGRQGHVESDAGPGLGGRGEVGPAVEGGVGKGVVYKSKADQ